MLNSVGIHRRGFVFRINDLNEIECKEDIDELIIDNVIDFSLLSLFHNLTKLTIKNTMITELPKEVMELKNLKVLICRNTKLNSLPENINILSNLEELICIQNELTSIPESICQLPKLWKLFFSYGNIRKIPENIDKLQNLEYLCFAYQNLRNLPKSITKLNEVEIHLNNNELVINDREIIDFLAEREIFYLEESNFLVYSDAQNSHNTMISKSIMNSIIEIMKNESGNLKNL